MRFWETILNSTKRSLGKLRAELMSSLESPSEAVKFFYAIHKDLSKKLQETVDGHTPEEAFWIVFAVLAAALWEGQDEAEHEIKLSELLRLYLTIYCEDLNPTLAIQDEPNVLEQLRKKYYAVREILLQSEDIEHALAKLCLWLQGSPEQGNIIRSVGGTIYIAEMVNDISPLPFRFVQDV